MPQVSQIAACSLAPSPPLWVIGIPFATGAWYAYADWEDERNGKPHKTDVGLALFVGAIWPYVLLFALSYFPMVLLLPRRSES